MSTATLEAPDRTESVASTPAEPAPRFWPDVQPGDVVHHWTSDDRPEQPLPAIVTKVLGGGNLCLSIVAPNSRTLSTADRAVVPHCDTPGIDKNAYRQRMGKWDLTPQEATRRRQIAELTAQVAMATNAIADLQNSLGVKALLPGAKGS